MGAKFDLKIVLLQPQPAAIQIPTAQAVRSSVESTAAPSEVRKRRIEVIGGGSAAYAQEVEQPAVKRLAATTSDALHSNELGNSYNSAILSNILAVNAAAAAAAANPAAASGTSDQIQSVNAFIQQPPMSTAFFNLCSLSNMNQL